MLLGSRRRAWLLRENLLFGGLPLRLLLWGQDRIDLVIVLLAQRVPFCVLFLLGSLGIVLNRVDVCDILFDDRLNLFHLSGR